jgi:hypothetical protein
MAHFRPASVSCRKFHSSWAANTPSTILWAGNPLEGMSFKADVAMQIRNLPDGTKIRLQVKE